MKSNPSSWLLPRIQDIFFISLFVAVALLGQRMLNLDGDLPRHLLMGKYILETGSLPTTEMFIYPYFGQPYVPHEWLTNVIFYAIYKYTSLAGIVAFCAFLLACTFTILFNNLSTRLSMRIPIFMIIAWGAMTTSINWAVRPHLVSMFLLAIWLVWTNDLRLGRKIGLWRFPVFMIVWSNLHGEFIAGILVLIANSAGWTIDYIRDRTSTDLNIGKNLWLVLLLSILASLINPSGIDPWVNIFGFVNNQYLMSRMLEANPPNFQMTEIKVFLGMLAFSIFLLAIKKDKMSSAQGLLLAGFSAMGLLATRNIHLYGIVAPFILAEALVETNNIAILRKLEGTLETVERNIKGVFWPVATTLLLGTFLITNIYTKKFYEFSPSMFPIKAVEWLEKNPQTGKMFNDLNWGGYIAWKLWPNQLTFTDSMADVTGDVTMEYETAIILAPNWEDIFNKYDIEWAILPVHSPLAFELMQAKGWHSIYQDETAIILHK
jgi:hypothetical protein